MTEYDAANERHIKIARREARAMADARRGFVSHIMGLADGRAYIHDLLRVCDALDKQVFLVDPYENAFWCGVRHVGAMLRADIMDYCPDDFVLMMREANARNTTSDARRERSDQDAGGTDSGPVSEYVHPGFIDGNDSSPAADAGRQAADYNPIDRDGEDGGTS